MTYAFINPDFAFPMYYTLCEGEGFILSNCLKMATTVEGEEAAKELAKAIAKSAGYPVKIIPVNPNI